MAAAELTEPRLPHLSKGGRESMETLRAAGGPREMRMHRGVGGQAWLNANFPIHFIISSLLPFGL